MICLRKAMGGGASISVCLGTPIAVAIWGAAKGEALHTQAFFGNPLPRACALGALEKLRAIDASAGSSLS